MGKRSLFRACPRPGFGPADAGLSVFETGEASQRKTTFSPFDMISGFDRILRITSDAGLPRSVDKVDGDGIVSLLSAATAWSIPHQPQATLPPPAAGRPDPGDLMAITEFAESCSSHWTVCVYYQTRTLRKGFAQFSKRIQSGQLPRPRSSRPWSSENRELI